jgi:TIP41-like family
MTDVKRFMTLGLGPRLISNGRNFFFQICPPLQKINYEKLKEKERIMFFDDVILYEDELDDNGCSKLSVKIVSSNQSVLLNSLTR